MKHLQDLIIKPIISEKSFSEANNENKYSFVVARGANKTEIKNAIEALFNVSVKKVYTANIKGSKLRNTKTRRFTVDTSYKKARVLVAKGQKIAIFEEAAEEKKDKKEKKTKETNK